MRRAPNAAATLSKKESPPRTADETVTGATIWPGKRLRLRHNATSRHCAGTGRARPCSAQNAPYWHKPSSTCPDAESMKMQAAALPDTRKDDPETAFSRYAQAP